MIAYRLLVDKTEVFVLLPASHPNQAAAIEYRGDEAAVAVVKGWLEWEYGAFGHLLTAQTTPIDLDAAMSRERAKPYSPYRFVGGELVQRYDPGIPPGTLT